MGMYSFICITSLLFIGAYAGCNRNQVPDLSYKLSGTELAFPCESTKNIYTQTGRYIARNIIATRMAIFKDQAIVALPRYKHGVPFTLAKFSLNTRNCRAVMEPFPCWKIQEEGNCDALQNAIDVFIDANEVLWVLDIGICNTLEQPVRRCNPKIVGINLVSGLVVKNIDLSSFVTCDSRLNNLIVDYAPDGRPFAYVSDGGSGSIIVIELITGTGFRIVLPKAAAASDGYNADVLYMALARKSCGNVLYFTYLSSPRLFSIKVSFLQKGQANGAVVDVGGKPQGSAIVLLGTDNGAAIFFRYKGESDVYLWNSETPFKCENFLLVQKGGDCRLPTQVVPGYKKLMWSIESNFHDFLNGCVGCLGPSMVVHPLVKTFD